MAMHKALHPRYHIDRRNVSRKEGGRGLPNIEDNADGSIRWREDYMKKKRTRKGKLLYSDPQPSRQSSDAPV